jgi:hypothetical protein
MEQKGCETVETIGQPYRAQLNLTLSNPFDDPLQEHTMKEALRLINYPRVSLNTPFGGWWESLIVEYDLGCFF